MSSESAPEQTIGDKIVEVLDQIHDSYNSVEAQVRKYTPYVVRTVEVILGVVLLGYLAHWLHWVYIAGAG